MKRPMLAIGLAIPLLWVLADDADSPQQAKQPQPPSSTDAKDARQMDPVRRGEYLVHHVAMCIYCHTPRNEDGTLDRQRLLSGAPMPVKSPFSDQQWAFRAPSLRGLPGGWTEQNVVHFLQTREPPTPHSVLPPMPPFLMNEQDSRSIAAYLKSLGP